MLTFQLFAAGIKTVGLGEHVERLNRFLSQDCTQINLRIRKSIWVLVLFDFFEKVSFPYAPTTENSIPFVSVICKPNVR